jgi:hypothetical protein
MNDLYTLNGLENNNILIDPILIHIWILANLYRPYQKTDLGKIDMDSNNELYDLLFAKKFTDDNTIQVTTGENILIYTECNCNYEEPVIDQILNGQYTANEFDSSKLCVLTNTAVNAPYL